MLNYKRSINAFYWKKRPDSTLKLLEKAESVENLSSSDNNPIELCSKTDRSRFNPYNVSRSAYMITL